MNSFNKFILRLDTAEKRICKPEDGLTDNFQSVTQRKRYETSRNCGTISNGLA